MEKDTQIVILCGGKGTRLVEETETKPKPMVNIGGMPILWHIMKIYSHYGYNNFVLCLGYKGEKIKEFFEQYKNPENWSVSFAETGLEAQTGTRIKRAEKYIKDDMFLATYGDAVSNIDVSKLVNFHKNAKTIGTLTGVHPHSKWGLIKSTKNGIITEFVEKPVLYDYVNGGFFAFQKDFFDYLSSDENCIMEADPFAKLVKDKQFSMYKHEGFWHAMDTYKDFLELNKIWDSGKVPWNIW